MRGFPLQVKARISVRPPGLAALADGDPPGDVEAPRLGAEGERPPFAEPGQVGEDLH